MDEEAKNVIGHEEEAAAATVNNDVSINNDVIDLCAPSTSANAIKDVAGGISQSECPICLQTCVHPARLPCGHIFCFLCVKGVAYKNRRCAMCRREISLEYLEHPELVNGIEDIVAAKTTEDGYQWFYEGRNGWWLYDDRTSQEIEDAFKKGEKSCTILVAGNVYVIDLQLMLQQRHSDLNRCRRVKRDLATVPKKGVAGLRIDGNRVSSDSNYASPPMAAVYEPTPDEDINSLAVNAMATFFNDDRMEQLQNLRARHRGENHANVSGSALTSASTAERNGRAPIGETQDLLTTLTQSISAEARNQQINDQFEQTLSDLQALTLRNIIDSSSSDEEENGGDMETLRQIRF